MPAIRRPGVEITQEFVTASPTLFAPSLPAVFLGPCFQIVDAFDDNGDPQDDALAGVYRDGEGTIAYDLPNLNDEADLTSFEDDIRVFLVLGSDVTELDNEDDEEIITSGTGSGALTYSTGAFVDGAATFEQVGVEVGDVVRITWRDEEVDLEITAIVSDTEVTVTTAIDEDLAALDYEIIRNPAQFVFDVAAMANAELGDEDDYIRFTVLAASIFAGDAGDDLSIEFVESTSVFTGTDAYVGDTIFTSATAAFVASVGAIGVQVDKLAYVGAGADDGGTFRDITHVISGTKLLIETGEGPGGSGLTYSVGDDSGAAFTAGTGATDGTVGTGAVLTVTGGDFDTSIPNTAGTPDQTTYVELSTGVYLVEAVNSDDSLDYFSTAASVSLTGENPVFILETATAADGATGALTDLVSPTGGLDTIVSPTSYSVELDAGSGQEAAVIATVPDEFTLTLAGGFSTDLANTAFAAVDTTLPLTLSFDPVGEKISVQLERTTGISASTFAEIEDAIMTLSNPSYNATVSGHIAAALGGTTGLGATVIDADLNTLPQTEQFDGGADDEQLILDADLIGSATPTGKIYVSYQALRLDVTDQAANPFLSNFSNTTEVDEAIGPISTDNPLALACFFGLANSPTRTVNALGVSEVAPTTPNGTLEAYISALSFLEGHEVYAMCTLTQDETVAQVLETHIDAMSAPTGKMERIGFFNTDLPLYSRADLVASGTDGNTGTFVGENPAEFTAGNDFTLAGATAGDILVVTALASPDDSPDIVNGTANLYGATILGVKSGDDFTLELDASVIAGFGAGWDDQVDVSFTLYRAGSSITQPVDQAAAIAAVGEGFVNRRMFHVWPDEVTATVSGTASIIGGYYAGAAWAAKVGQEKPEQGFTNGTIAGFTGVRHANGYFSETNLDNIAGGGTFITVQDSQSAPLSCRHQLSTDVSTIQKRELSITKVIDFAAKFYRAALKKQIGRFNITQSFLDALVTTIQGLGRALVEGSTLNGAKLISLEVDETNPDTINIVVLVDVPFPVNYIALTIQV